MREGASTVWRLAAMELEDFAEVVMKKAQQFTKKAQKIEAHMKTGKKSGQNPRTR